MPLMSNFQSVHMHVYVGDSSIAIISNFIEVEIYNLLLYDPKLHLERHIVKLQFVGVFLLSTTYLWMLKSHKCYDASFATLNNMMLFLFHQSFRMVLIFCTPNSFFWIFMMFILNKYILLFLCRGYDISCSSFSS